MVYNYSSIEESRVTSTGAMMVESILIIDKHPDISELINQTFLYQGDIRTFLTKGDESLSAAWSADFQDASRKLIRSSLSQQPFHILGVKALEEAGFCAQLQKLREHSPVSEVFLYQTPEFFLRNQDLIKNLHDQVMILYLPLSGELIRAVLPRLHSLFTFHRQNRDYLRSLEDRITKRTNSLNAANEELKKLGQEKENLVRILCHDLSNSVGIVQFCSEKGSALSADPDMARLWTKVGRAVNQQTELVNFVREMDALKAGKSTIKPGPVSLKKMFDNVEFSFSDKLKAKDLLLERNLRDEQDLHILADEVIFGNTILNNLISNAIKFSRKNSTISMTAVREKKEAMIRVSDTGIGIPDWLLRDLFDFEKKTSRPGTEGEQGTGFGMPLVKSYVDILGGQIRVESRDIKYYAENHGTTFSLIFPLVLNSQSDSINQE